MGAVPAGGEWVRVEIPLSQFGIEETTLSVIDFAYVDGQVWFDHFGKTGTGCTPARAAAPQISSGDTAWIEDGLPVGALLVGPHCETSQAAAGTQSLTHYYQGNGKTYGAR